jgi:hypothetical protein
MVETPDPGMTATRRALRTPRSAAVAGIAFAMLLLTTFILVRISIPSSPDQQSNWLANGGHRGLGVAVTVLVPFAGIAFLWFIGVIRDRVGSHEDRFFATVFLGSGLLFVAMLFTASALMTGMLAAFGSHSLPSGSEPMLTFGRSVTYTVLTVYAMKMAAVFTLSTTTIVSRTTNAPRWLTVSGYLTTVILLISAGLVPWMELIFPLWVLALSLHILVASQVEHPKVVTDR